MILPIMAVIRILPLSYKNETIFQAKDAVAMIAPQKAKMSVRVSSELKGVLTYQVLFLLHPVSKAIHGCP